MTAKMKGKPHRAQTRSDWDHVRVNIMRWCLRVKLAQNWTSFSALLLETGERPIVEESRKDPFWGAKPVDDQTLVGMNVLGRLLMELREAIKEQEVEALSTVRPLDIPNFLLNGQPIEAIEYADVNGVGSGEEKPVKAADVGRRERSRRQPSLLDWRPAGDFPPESKAASETRLNDAPELAPFPAMRSTGVAWLAECPSHWEMRRNGRLFQQVTETGHPDLPVLEVSLRTGVRVRDLDNGGRKQVMSDREKYKRAREGDLAYNMMRMWQGAVGVAPVDGLVSPAYVVARAVGGANSRYYERVFRTPAYMGQVDRYSRGIVKDRNRLYWNDFKQILSPFPPPEEQEAIVRFLDHMDRRIGRYVRAKKKLIKLLEEQKQAIVHRAVTRGRDQATRLKPSGVKWLGDVPGHWEAVRFKRRIGFQEGPGIMAADFRDAGIPLLRISCLQGETASLDGCNFLDPKMVERRWSHFAVRPGDYLLSASASTGSVVLATDVVAGAIPYTGILRLWPLSDAAYMPFVRLYMGSRPFQNQIDAAKSGVGIEHFGPTHLRRMSIALPPPSEQREIVQSIESQLAPFAGAVERAKRATDLLLEYLTRLVADVVTGRLDVREAAGRLPDGAGEADSPNEDDLLMGDEEAAEDLDPDYKDAEA